jgi:D-alanyl-D-alanine carboxypeptidase
MCEDSGTPIAFCTTRSSRLLQNYVHRLCGLGSTSFQPAAFAISTGSSRCGTPNTVASALSPAQRVETIAIWSALPGASRHHWGTDLDLIDRNTMSEGYRVRLEQTEYAPGGVFHPMAVWLEANAAKFGFFRPFRGIESAVPPEPWHYSYALTAEPARAQLTAEILREALQSCAIEGREFVLARLDELHGRFVARIDPPPAGLPAASPKYS